MHQQLRQARKQARLTQGELAKLAGIPRQQIVRAERGDNITIETLRSIAEHLPLTHLTLLENVELTTDLYPQPARIYFEAMAAVTHAFDTLRAAVGTALSARLALETALSREPVWAAEVGTLPPEDLALLRAMADVFRKFGIQENATAAQVDGSEESTADSEGPKTDS